MNATDRQVNGRHYKDMKIQPWEFIAANDLSFFQGSVVEYVCRYPRKGGVDDLRKALHYIEFMIETEVNKGDLLENQAAVGHFPDCHCRPCSFTARRRARK